MPYRYQVVSRASNGEDYYMCRVDTLAEAAKAAQTYLDEGDEVVYALPLDDNEEIISDPDGIWRRP